MKKLEVFYDYICPYCLKGHSYLVELMPKFPDVEVVWHPCESHPRPERYGLHSDLCARGMYIALDQGADLMEYHRRMYRAAQSDGADIEDVSVLMKVVEGLLDPQAFGTALSEGAYQDKLLEENRLVWEVYGFSAIPSYRMEGKALVAKPDVGVTRSGLEAFLR